MGYSMELDEPFLKPSDIDISIESSAMNKGRIKRTLDMNLLPILCPTSIFFKDFYFFIF